MKPEHPSSATPPYRATDKDWTVLRDSTPRDYVGTTDFARMDCTARLRWLDSAVIFLNRHGQKSVPPPAASSVK